MTITTQYTIGDTIYYPEVYALKPAGNEVMARAGKLKVASILVNINQNLSYSIFYKDDKRPCTTVAETNAYSAEVTALEVAEHARKTILGEHDKIKNENLNQRAGE